MRRRRATKWPARIKLAEKGCFDNKKCTTRRQHRPVKAWQIEQKCYTSGDCDEVLMTILNAPLSDRVPIRMDADGVARIGNTRVRLETLVEAFHSGHAAE